MESAWKREEGGGGWGRGQLGKVEPGAGEHQSTETGTTKAVTERYRARATHLRRERPAIIKQKVKMYIEGNDGTAPTPGPQGPESPRPGTVVCP